MSDNIVNSKRTIFSSSLPSVTRRLFWLCMLLAHVGGVRSALMSLFQPVPGVDWGLGLARMLILVASTIFFVLKIADVACLRLKPGWRTWVMSTVVIALLHVQVMNRATGVDLDVSRSAPVAILVLGGLLDSQTLRRILRRLLSVFRRMEKPGIFALNIREYARHWMIESVPPNKVHFVVGLLTPRPPPIR